ncbi:hypothetical protein Taro_006972 [Colocasia esculenta]|uniref:Uncharacterized protein n=1 Tax=Colocasia esculenta TaxID=4460 RepID=A0A843TQ54_COLES|nr:hypothetical protein [Colocasia esculenta]
MFNSTRDLLHRSWIWVPEHRRYSDPLRFIPTPSAKELDKTFRMCIGIAYVTTIRNRHSETADRALVSRSDSLDYANHWRSPHAEPPSHSDQKSCSTRREISSIGRGYSSDSLHYANRWRSPHAEPPSHSDWKPCSTRREISSTGRGYGCPNIADIVTPSAKELGITFRTGIEISYVATIRNQHSEMVDRALVSSDSLDYENHWRIPHAEPPSHSARKPCSTRREISSTGRGYGCPNIADIVTPSEARDAPYCLSSDSLDYANRWRSTHTEPPSHSDRKSCSTRREISSTGRYTDYRTLRSDADLYVPGGRIAREAPIQNRHIDRVGKELGITFRTGIGIAYVNTIRNRHAETVDRALVSRNSVLGQKFLRSVCTSTPITVPSGRTGIFMRPGVGIERKAPILNRHFDPRLRRLRESLAEPTHRASQSQRSDVVFNSTRDLLPRSWIWVPEHRRYSHPLRFIPTPSAKELGITFRTDIGIAYVTTIQNRHAETVDRALVSRNTVPGQKFPPERVY